MDIQRIARQSMVLASLLMASVPSIAQVFNLQLPKSAPDAAYDGRMILILAADDSKEPKDQVKADFNAAQIFGANINGLKRGQSVTIGGKVLGFPARSLSDVPAGEYSVQAVLHKYETFNLSNGKTVKLPEARGAGQNWRKEPGNLVSKPFKVKYDPKSNKSINKFSCYWYY